MIITTYMHSIYIWQNMLNNKIWIGQSVNPNARRKAHIRKAFEMHYTHPLYDSMRKHGLTMFKFDIIEHVDEKDVDDAEIFWISFFRSWDREFGYNIEHGGRRQKHVTQSTRDKLSAKARGRIVSETTKEKLKHAHKGKQYRLGHIATSQTIEKLRLSHLKLGKEVLDLRDKGLTYYDIAFISNVSYGAARNAVRYWENIRSNAPDNN